MLSVLVFQVVGEYALPWLVYNVARSYCISMSSLVTEWLDRHENECRGATCAQIPRRGEPNVAR